MTRRLLATLTATLTVALLAGPPAIAQGPSGPPGGGGGGGGGAPGGGSGGGEGSGTGEGEADFKWKTHRVPGCGINVDLEDRPCPTVFGHLSEGNVRLSDRETCGGRCKPNPRLPLGFGWICSDFNIGEQNNLLVNRGPDWFASSFRIGNVGVWEANRVGKCKRERRLWCITSKRCECRFQNVRGTYMYVCTREAGDDDRKHSLGAFAFSANGTDCKVGQPWGGEGPPPPGHAAEGDCYNQDEP